MRLRNYDPHIDYPRDRWDAEVFGKIAKYYGLEGPSAAPMTRHSLTELWMSIQSYLASARKILYRGGIKMTVTIEPIDIEVTRNFRYEWEITATTTLPIGALEVEFYEKKSVRERIDL